MQRARFRRRRLISPQKPAAPLIAHNQGFEISCSRKRRGGGGRQRGEWKRSKSPACGVSFDPPAELNGRKWKPLCGSKESSFQPPACLSPATGAARLPCLQCPSSLGRSWLKVRDGAGLLWEAGTVAVPLPRIETQLVSGEVPLVEEPSLHRGGWISSFQLKNRRRAPLLDQAHCPGKQRCSPILCL